MFTELLAGILLGVECPGSVYSIVPCGDNSWCFSMWQQVYTYLQEALPTSTQCNTQYHESNVIVQQTQLL